MKFLLEIDIGGNTFEDDPGFSELNRCVQRTLNKLANGKTEGAVLDANGNTIGSFSIGEYGFQEG